MDSETPKYSALWTNLKVFQALRESYYRNHFNSRELSNEIKELRIATDRAVSNTVIIRGLLYPLEIPSVLFSHGDIIDIFIFNGYKALKNILDGKPHSNFQEATFANILIFVTELHLGNIGGKRGPKNVESASNTKFRSEGSEEASNSRDSRDTAVAGPSHISVSNAEDIVEETQKEQIEVRRNIYTTVQRKGKKSAIILHRTEVEHDYDKAQKEISHSDNADDTSLKHNYSEVQQTVSNANNMIAAGIQQSAEESASSCCESSAQQLVNVPVRTSSPTKSITERFIKIIPIETSPDIDCNHGKKNANPRGKNEHEIDNTSSKIRCGSSYTVLKKSDYNLSADDGDSIIYKLRNRVIRERRSPQSLSKINFKATKIRKYKIIEGSMTLTINDARVVPRIPQRILTRCKNGKLIIKRKLTKK